MSKAALIRATKSTIASLTNNPFPALVFVGDAPPDVVALGEPFVLEALSGDMTLSRMCMTPLFVLLLVSITPIGRKEHQSLQDVWRNDLRVIKPYSRGVDSDVDG
jgi:hypothetical protein